MHKEVTITANSGWVQEPVSTIQPVNIIGQLEIEERVQSVVAEVVKEEVGVSLQRTTPRLPESSSAA